MITKVKNTTGITIKLGTLVYGKYKDSWFQHLLFWLKLKKRKTFTITGIVKAIDISKWENGDVLYLYNEEILKLDKNVQLNIK